MEGCRLKQGLRFRLQLNKGFPGWDREHRTS